MTSKISTRPATPQDLAAICNLHAKVFGPGRYARSAYRVREGNGLITRFCRVAEANGQIAAALRMTDVTIGSKPGAALLGPIAVDAAYHGQGFGTALINAALQAAREAGLQIVILIGDQPYYGRFGFKIVAPGQITLPGPVNPARLLAAEIKDGALKTYQGVVSALPDASIA